MGYGNLNVYLLQSPSLVPLDQAIEFYTVVNFSACHCSSMGLSIDHSLFRGISAAVWTNPQLGHSKVCSTALVWSYSWTTAPSGLYLMCCGLIHGCCLFRVTNLKHSELLLRKVTIPAKPSTLIEAFLAVIFQIVLPHRSACDQCLTTLNVTLGSFLLLVYCFCIRCDSEPTACSLYFTLVF